MFYDLCAKYRLAFSDVWPREQTQNTKTKPAKVRSLFKKPGDG